MREKKDVEAREKKLETSERFCALSVSQARLAAFSRSFLLPQSREDAL